MTRKLFVLLAFVLMLGSAVSYAQVRGSIEGTVVDEYGDPLPGVVVKAESEAMMQPRYYTTDENGFYRLIELPPASDYTVEFRMMGFQTIIRTGLDVRVNRVTRVDAELKEVAFEEQVVITGAAPVLDTTSSTSGVNLDRDFTERLPGADNYQSALSVQGGTTGAGNVRVRGGQRFSNLYMFDGVDTTDPLTGTFGANLNADAVAETEIMTGGMPAEFGRASGGVINVVTKSGGNDFSGSLRIKYVDPSWQLSSDYYDDPGGATRFEPTLSIGGPILRDKLWFFISYRRISIEGDQTVRRRSWATGDFVETTWDREQLWQYLYAKLTWSLSPEHQIFLTFNNDPMEWENYGLSTGTLSDQTLATWKQGGSSFGLNWTWIINQNLFLETKIGIGRQILDVESASMEPNWTVRHPNTAYTPIVTGSFGWSYDTDRDRDSLDISAKYFMSDMAGSHEWKVGMAYHELIGGGGYVYPDESYSIYLNENYTFDEYGPWDDSSYWTEDSTRTVRYDQVFSATEADYLAFYIQDRWRPDFIDGFTTNIGVRFESHAAYNNLGTKVVSHGLFDMIAPRVGLVWDIGNTGKHKVSAFYGRFYSIWSTMVANITIIDTAWSELYRWNPGTGQWDLESATTPGEPSGIIDPDIKPEYTDEFTISYERELSSNWAAGISYTRKLNKNVPEDYIRMYDADGNIIWDGPGSEDRGVYDPDVVVDNYYYVFETMEGAKRDYWGFELYTNARLRNLTLMASYTLSESKGTVFDTNEGSAGLTYTSVYFDTPDLSENLYGFTPYHIKHYVKLNASYMFNWGTSVGLSGFWRSGYHYSRVRRGNTIHGIGSYGWFIIADDERGQNQLPSVWFVDLSLQHDFNLGRFGSLTLIGDIYNVTNNQLVLAQQRNDTSTFGEDTAWSSPMSWQVSLLYRF